MIVGLILRVSRGRYRRVQCPAGVAGKPDGATGLQVFDKNRELFQLAS